MNQSPICDVGKLAIIAAIFTLISDFITLLITYEEYRQNLTNNTGNGAQNGSEPQTTAGRQTRPLTPTIYRGARG